MIDKILINLKIISKIRENDRIYINMDRFIIVEQNSIFLSIYRFYYSLNRNKNINNIISIFKDIFEYINNNIENKNLTSISNELKNSIIGLQNLKVTYKNDILIDSKLDIIIDNINNYIILINKKIEK